VSEPRTRAAEPWIVLTADALDDAAARARVEAAGHGAALLFYGNVRDRHEGRIVHAVEYGAYEPMAESELRAVAVEVAARHGGPAVAVLHRLGRLPVGATSLVVAVGAAHRREAFACGLEIIDELKRRVPIWKKEIGPDGARWQDGFLPGQT
jgi:molybdopterin synthase catalytic subunit